MTTDLVIFPHFFSVWYVDILLSLLLTLNSCVWWCFECGGLYLLWWKLGSYKSVYVCHLVWFSKDNTQRFIDFVVVFFLYIVL